MMMMMMMIIIIIMEDTYWKDPDVSSHIQRYTCVTQLIILIDLIRGVAEK